MKPEFKPSLLWKLNYPMFKCNKGEVKILRKLLKLPRTGPGTEPGNYWLCTRALNFWLMEGDLSGKSLKDKIQRCMRTSLLESYLYDNGCPYPWRFRLDAMVTFFIYIRYIWVVKLINYNTKQRTSHVKRKNVRAS